LLLVATPILITGSRVRTLDATYLTLL